MWSPSEFSLPKYCWIFGLKTKYVHLIVFFITRWNLEIFATWPWYSTIYATHNIKNAPHPCFTINTVHCETKYCVFNWLIPSFEERGNLSFVHLVFSKYLHPVLMNKKKKSEESDLQEEISNELLPGFIHHRSSSSIQYGVSDLSLQHAWSSTNVGFDIPSDIFFWTPANFSFTFLAILW